MKKIQLFTADWCPHCSHAKAWIKELQQQNPEYAKLDIQTIDVDHQKEKLEGLHFEYIPTFYIDGEKVVEGATQKEQVKSVLDKAL
ncbi:thioredoxin family protein [Criibacterium bergeronii]|uniref:Thioredoxin n=1 Tax=Criibacterium bergeronii TaxID=1871336 RepID=A0A371IKI3_9FIRM|nr:thioredoxin family protein [Criibacterium bergeronii]MBS6063141.1 thioredoxin family protein [Peptostreptococcaceae bacterium]RDY20960.1 thioredoxin [Criibacterium bergeronii]TRW27012.1 thioredoxin family protein [Criibacterium bergeronii]